MAVSRVRALHELQSVVDTLGDTITKLGDIATAIDKLVSVRNDLAHASELHASLETALARDIGSVERVVAKYEFDVDAVPHLLPFSSCVESIVDMFMTDINTEM
jgi:hypothetical protein